MHVFEFITTCFPLDLNLIVVAVPLYKPRDAYLNWRRGPVTHIFFECRYVGRSRRYVSLLHRLQIEHRPSPQRLLKELDIAQELYRSVIPNVVDPVRRLACRGVGNITAPFAVRLRRMIDDAENALNDIVNKC